MAHLGQGHDKKVDLPMARQTIDLLGLLEDKTKGNLDAEEAKLLDSLLQDCRARFVEISSGKAPQSS
jgi:hypothetical protein